MKKILGFRLVPILLLLPISSQAIVINQGNVTFNPKKSDSFQIVGSFTNLSLDQADQVRLDVGSFS
jgi:hypothetical protein